jgi:hypothetical protein
LLRILLRNHLKKPVFSYENLVSGEQSKSGKALKTLDFLGLDGLGETAPGSTPKPEAPGSNPGGRTTKSTRNRRFCLFLVLFSNLFLRTENG